MNTIKINYNYDTDETKIKFNDEFNSLPMVKQIDAIQNGLVLLMRRYNTLLHIFDERWETFQELHDQDHEG